MTKRSGDDTPEPPGGRAAERLREFRKARMPSDEEDRVLPSREGGDQQAEDSDIGSPPGQPPDKT